MTGPRAGKHVLALDGVRAIACGMVLYEHLTPHVAHVCNWGYIGVRLFFVLSGFLITGILLDARSSAEVAGNWASALRIFYARRFLRIFPVYYLTIALAYAAGMSDFHTYLGWYASYLTNWFIMAGHPYIAAAHFWSLGVEEQFYLVWPWLMLLFPRRWLLGTILGAIALAAAVRLALVLHHESVVTVTYNTPACLDTLGLGGLLAYAQRSPKRWLSADTLRTWAPRIAVPMIFFALPIHLWRTHYVLTFTFEDVCLGLFFVSFVAGVPRLTRGPLHRFLTLPLVTYVGRISYGLYVYHWFSPHVFAVACRLVGVIAPSADYAVSLWWTAVSFAMAIASWHLFESPLNGLKRFFEYDGRAVVRGSPEGSAAHAGAPQ